VITEAPPLVGPPAPVAGAAAPPSAEPMAAVDCAWLRMDGRTNLMVIHGIHMFDAPLDRERLRRVFTKRLAAVPRFRRRVVERAGRLWWEEMPGFDAAAHLTEVELPPGSGDTELRAYVGRRMSEPLPLHRPLWEVTVVRGYGSGEALVWRLHHCLGDGIALMVLMLALTDLHADGDAGSGPHAWGSDNPLADLFGATPQSPQEALRDLEQILPEGAKLLVRPAEELAKTSVWLRALGWLPTFAKLSLRWPDPKSRFKGPRLSGDKRVAWSRPIPLAEVREAKAAVGGTVNDVLLTTISGALRRYVESRGDRTAGLSFRAVMPVSLRPLQRMHLLGNQFGLIFLPLPIGVVEPRRRLEALKRNLASLKRSLEPLVVLHVLMIMGRLPMFLHKLVVKIFGTKGTVVLTSVPGPNRELYLAGQPIRNQVFWVPQSGAVGMGISIMTYAGQVTVGVMADAALVPDPEAIVAGFEAELGFLEELRANAPAASVG
jgi:diacylglycerol O-acyltransferase